MYFNNTVLCIILGKLKMCNAGCFSLFFCGGGGGEEYSWGMIDFSFVNTGILIQCHFISENTWFSRALTVFANTLLIYFKFKKIGVS